jgi:hypothetical protein
MKKIFDFFIILFLLISYIETLDKKFLKSKKFDSIVESIFLAIYNYQYPYVAMINSIYDYFLGDYIDNVEEYIKNWDEKRNNIIEKLIEDTKMKFNNFKFNEVDEKRIIEKEKNILNLIFKEENEEIFDKILYYVSNDSIEEIMKDIDNINVICLGRSQIGKTALINNILFLEENEKGKEGGDCESTTMNDTIYSSRIIKHLKITDTRGIEQGKFNIDGWLDRYKNKTEKDIKEGKFGDLIHSIWYCVNGNLMNDDEIEAINKISEIFNGYNVPIIFVYLKPFEGDIDKMRNRTEKINNNFIEVQSKNYTKIYSIYDGKEKKDFSIFYKQRNMDKLLLLTKDLAFNGIINSIASKKSSDIKEEAIKIFNKKINKGLNKLKNYIKNFEKKLENKEAYEKIINDMKKTKELALEILVNLFEEILNINDINPYSFENLKSLIFLIQKELEEEYSNKLYIYQKVIISQYKKEIQNQRISFFVEKYGKYLSGVYDLDDDDFEEDFNVLENKFDSMSLISIYSFKKSLEKIYNFLEQKLPKMIESNIIEIISDENLKKNLEQKIKIISKDKIKRLMEEFEKNIHFFQKNN